MKKILSLVLCFILIFNAFPVTAFANEEQNLEEIIRPQVEAFAKSIDQKDANGAAQDALISHGMFGNGKKLSVGKSHAITATLVNSVLGKEFLTKTSEELIKSAKEFDMNEIYSLGGSSWKIERGNSYSIWIYDYNAKKYRNSANIDTCPSDAVKKMNYKASGENEYDKTLELIAGVIDSDIDLKIKEVREDKIIYEISTVLWDDFDFDAESGTDLEDLLGFIGMLLFEPFEWESKFSFQIEIPIEKPEENGVFGDSDGNGQVDVMDAYFIRLVAAKLVEPTAEQLALCDVDGDGKITAIDANIIRKFAAGIIDKLPVQ